MQWLTPSPGPVGRRSPSDASLRRVLAIDSDVAFLTAAYQLVLGRLPDEVGIRSFLTSLALKKASRVDVLRSLLDSEEAAIHGVVSSGMLFSELETHAEAGSDSEELALPVLPLLLSAPKANFADMVWQILYRRDCTAEERAAVTASLGGGDIHARLRVIHELASMPGASLSKQTAEDLQQLGNHAGSVPPIDAEIRNYEAASLINGSPDEFVRNAYAAILKREPDADGLRHNVNELLSGRRSRLEVLNALMRSDEGRNVGVRINGLGPIRTRSLLFSLPVLGRILRSLAVLWNATGLEAETRSLSETCSRMRAELEHLNFVYGLKKSGISASSVQAEGFASSIAGLMRRTAGLEAGFIETAVSVSTQSAALAGIRDNLQQLSTQVAADTEHLRTLEAARITKAALDTLLDQKADWLEVHSELQLKADAAMVACKVDASALRSFQDKIEDSMSAKANSDALAALETGLIELRAMAQEEARRLQHVVFREGTPEEYNRLVSIYMDFENVFRGSEADIAARQSIFVERIRATGAGVPGAPVLDIGAGRGEWLSLLRSHGMTARGIDTNPDSIQYCQSAGLDVCLGEMLSYLRLLPSDCIGFITAFHVIEHVPVERLIPVLDEMLRVLIPGGGIALETPNPANLIVGSHTFYLDPTHRRPIPSALLRFFLENRGFSDVEILPLHPALQYSSSDSEPMAERYKELMYGPQDYVAFGAKPRT